MKWRVLAGAALASVLLAGCSFGFGSVLRDTKPPVTAKAPAQTSTQPGQAAKSAKAQPAKPAQPSQSQKESAKQSGPAYEVTEVGLSPAWYGDSQVKEVTTYGNGNALLIQISTNVHVYRTIDSFELPALPGTDEVLWFVASSKPDGRSLASTDPKDTTVIVSGPSKSQKASGDKYVFHGPFEPGWYVFMTRTASYPVATPPMDIRWTSPWKAKLITVSNPPVNPWLKVTSDPPSGSMLEPGQMVRLHLEVDQAWCQAHPGSCHYSGPPPLPFAGGELKSLPGAGK